MYPVLPRGSPPSLVLFILYALALMAEAKRANESETSYVHDEVMIQNTTYISIARCQIQRLLDNKLELSTDLNIRFAPSKRKLIHMTPLRSKHKPKESPEAIELYDLEGLPTNVVRSLGLFIKHRLNFRVQVAAAGAKTCSLALLLAKASQRKVASPASLHYLATTAIIPAMVWES